MPLSCTLILHCYVNFHAYELSFTHITKVFHFYLTMKVAFALLFCFKQFSQAVVASDPSLLNFRREPSISQPLFAETKHMSKQNHNLWLIPSLILSHKAKLRLMSCILTLSSLINAKILREHYLSKKLTTSWVVGDAPSNNFNTTPLWGRKTFRPWHFASLCNLNNTKF